MILSCLLDTLNRACRLALKYDEVTHARLKDCVGRIIALEITDWTCVIHCHVLAEGDLSFAKPADDVVADATLSGRLIPLMRSGLAMGDASVVRDQGVQIHGDLELAQSLQAILTGLDIDWEAALADVVGDTAGHHLMKFARRVFSCTSETAQQCVEQTARYLKTDAQCLVTPEECRQFCQQVTVLRYDVDRLAAQIAALEAKQ